MTTKDIIQLDEEQHRDVINSWKEDAAKCRTVDDACAFAHRLLNDYHHDYGTICHALAAGASAMAWGMNGESGGITGFQSGFVFWGFYRNWMGEEGPARLVKYYDLLYPQYDNTYGTITPETRDELIKHAKELLDEGTDMVSPMVLKRWNLIASGKLPSFVRVESQ
jgi:hypothetical protein